MESLNFTIKKDYLSTILKGKLGQKWIKNPGKALKRSGGVTSEKKF